MCKEFIKITLHLATSMNISTSNYVLDTSRGKHWITCLSVHHNSPTDPNVQHRSYKIQPLDTILNWIHPPIVFETHFCNIYLSVIFLSSSRFTISAL